MATEVNQAFQQEHASPFQNPPQLGNGKPGSLTKDEEKPVGADSLPPPPSGSAPAYEPPKVEDAPNESGSFLPLNGGRGSDATKEPPATTPAVNNLHPANPFATTNSGAEKSTDSTVKDKPVAAEPEPAAEKPTESAPSADEVAKPAVPEKPSHLQSDFVSQPVSVSAPQEPEQKADISNEPVPVGAAPFEGAPTKPTEPALAKASENAPGSTSNPFAAPAASKPAEAAPVKAPADSETAGATSSTAAAGPGSAVSGASAIPVGPSSTSANGALEDVEMTDAPAEATAAAPPVQEQAEKPVEKSAAPALTETPAKPTAEKPAPVSEAKAAGTHTTPVAGEKRKADDLTQDEPAANGNLAVPGKDAEPAAKASPAKKLKVAAGKAVDKAKDVIKKAKAKREKKPPPPVGRTQRKTRSQGPIDS